MKASFPTDKPDFDELPGAWFPFGIGIDVLRESKKFGDEF